MRTNYFAFKLLQLLGLAVVCSNLAYSSDAPSPAPAGLAGTPIQWKSITEDPAPWQREPFKKLESSTQEKSSTQNQESPEVALQGIMKINKHYYAIINGRTVKPSDNIDGWIVSKISRYQMTIRREKEVQIFDIYQGKIDRGTR